MTIASGSRFLRAHFLTTSWMPRASDRIGISATSGNDPAQVGQVERQAGTDHDGVGAAGACLTDVIGVGARRRASRSPPACRCRRQARWRQRFHGRELEIRAVDLRIDRGSERLEHQIGMMPAQVDRARSCRPRPRRATLPARRCAETPTPIPPCTIGSNARPRINSGGRAPRVGRLCKSIKARGRRRSTFGAAGCARRRVGRQPGSVPAQCNPTLMGSRHSRCPRGRDPRARVSNPTDYGVDLACA